MRDRKEHREGHCYFLTDYEKEEEFLREKHKSGQRLTKVSLPCFYYFEECDPEDVIYRLDFNPQSNEDRESYLQMFRDYGWEYLQDLNEYSYFRKSAKDTDQADLEIFSDDLSKLDMLKRIFMKRMIPVLVIFLLCVIPQMTNIAACMISGNFSGKVITWWAFIIWVVLFGIYSCILVHCGIGFYRLKKKYSEK